MRENTMGYQLRPPGNHMTRRRLLALAGGSIAASTIGPKRGAAWQTPEASPAAAAPAIADPPLPSTLAADASPEFGAVADALVEAMRRNRVPGTALGILFGDREEHATFGVASLNSLAPVSPDTLFQLGSLTKTHTASAIWSLADRGDVSIDAPVRTYIPELTLVDESVAAGVTIGNLLDHSAGWYGDEGFDTGDGDDAIARYVAERLPVLPQIFPLGAFASYNNAGFTLLGRLLEVATGTNYRAALENLLLGPLGLENSLLDHEAVLRRPYADGHLAMQINGHDALTVATPLWLPRSVDPAGGLWSTTRDVIRYARFHLAADESVAGHANIVSPESLLRMREPVLDAPGLGISLGRNWFVQEFEGIRLFQHNGDTLGFHTEFLVVPEHNFAFVLLTNGNGGALTAMEVLDAALALYPGLAGLSGRAGLTRSFLAPPDAPTVDLPTETIDEYIGHYEDPGTAISVASGDDGLEMTVETIIVPGTFQPAIQPLSPPAMPITFLGEDEAVAYGISRFPFVRDGEGNVGWVSSGLRLIPRIDGD
jgi:CubicO group peptidase (beta-lactamase class C family)